MGYYTMFELKAVNGFRTPAEEAAFETAFETQTGYPLGDLDSNLKWYDHREDMVALSTMFPEVTFRLMGEGEEQGDAWVVFFRNGQWEDHRPPEWTPPEKPSWL